MSEQKISSTTATLQDTLQAKPFKRRQRKARRRHPLTGKQKVCPRCKQLKDLSEFSRDTRNGYQSQCRDCRLAIQQAWRKNDPEAYHRSRLKRYLKFHYSLTLADYDALLEKQGGVCAICGKPELHPRFRFLSVDHDHKTEKIRGLLCFRCNRAIGLLGDDLSLLPKIRQYLSRSS